MIISLALLLQIAAAAPAVPSTPGAALRAEITRMESEAEAVPGSWTRVAVAWHKLARLEGDASHDAKAWDAVQRSLKLTPEDDEALRIKGWLQSARLDFEGAAETAAAAVKRKPNDWFSYGVLADANTELGRYPQAVAAVELMMRIRPGAPAYSRAAYLRGLHGDRTGAIELMRMALDSTAASDEEALAWARVTLGRELQAAGDLAQARKQYEGALHAVPGYGMALFHLAECQAAAGDLAGAMASLERLPEPRSVSALALLADLQRATGAAREAERTETRIQAMAERGQPGFGPARAVARFWADRGVNLERATALMRGELESRRDVETWDTLAWTLHRLGRSRDALKASDEALRLGTEDARLLYHRACIEAALDRPAEARPRLERAIALQGLWPGELKHARNVLASLAR